MSEVYVFWPSCWRWLTDERGGCWFILRDCWHTLDTWLRQRLRGPRVGGAGARAMAATGHPAPGPPVPPLSLGPGSGVQGCKWENIERSIISGKYERSSTISSNQFVSLRNLFLRKELVIILRSMLRECQSVHPCCWSPVSPHRYSPFPHWRYSRYTRGHVVTTPGMSHPHVSEYGEIGMATTEEASNLCLPPGFCYKSTSEPPPWARACLVPAWWLMLWNNESFRHIFAPGDWTWRHTVK